MFDENFLNDFTFRACLVSHQSHADHVFSECRNFVQRLSNFNTAAFTATTSMDLSFNNPNRSTDFFCCCYSFFWRVSKLPFKGRYAELSQDFFGLILMNIHFNYSDY
ncbi:hypothetical protein D3C87_1672290 [compost metagenome]